MKPAPEYETQSDNLIQQSPTSSEWVHFVCTYEKSSFDVDGLHALQLLLQTGKHIVSHFLKTAKHLLMV